MNVSFLFRIYKPSKSLNTMTLNELIEHIGYLRDFHGGDTKIPDEQAHEFLTNIINAVEK